jgi:hypothetical protein
MSRSWIRLRRVLFGVSCAIVFGVDATHAAAASSEKQARACTCQVTSYPYYVAEDCWGCPSTRAKCDGKSTTPICVP